jgi:hypothetical protein
MIKIRPYRYWFYFRQGWATYFAFIFAAINTMVVTYYLAIKDVPILEKVFPSFIYYLLTMAIIGVPLLIAIGYVHYKRIGAYHAETDIQTESNPYYYKLPPGYWKEAFVPTYALLTNLMVKLLKNEKLTDVELKEISELQNKMNELMRGGYVGKPNLRTFEEKDKGTKVE